MSARIRPGLRPHHCLDGLPLGAGDLDHAMAEVGDQPLQVERDQRLILDDHDVGGDLPRDFAAGFVDQLLQLALVDFEDGRCLAGREFLNGDQQESLARGRGQHVEVTPYGIQARMRRLLGPLVVPLD